MRAGPEWGLQAARELLASVVAAGVEIPDDVDARAVVVGRRFGFDFRLFSDRIASMGGSPEQRRVATSYWLAIFGTLHLQNRFPALFASI